MPATKASPIQRTANRHHRESTTPMEFRQARGMRLPQTGIAELNSSGRRNAHRASTDCQPIVSRGIKKWLRGHATVNPDRPVHCRGLNSAVTPPARQGPTPEYEVNEPCHDDV